MTLLTTLSIIMNDLTSAKSEFTMISQQRLNLENEIIKTSVMVRNLTLPTGDKSTFYMLASNVGSTKLWNYPKFDLLATYEANLTGTKTILTEKLTYGKRTNTFDYWVVDDYQQDLLDPKIINPDETVKIKGVLKHPAIPGSVISVVLTTDNGVSASKSVVVMD